MAVNLTEAIIQNLECADLTRQYNLALYSRSGALTREKQINYGLWHYQTKWLRTYVQNGTILTEGFVSEATLDFTGYATFGNLVGNIIVDGVIIATLPYGAYADLQEVITAIVDAINNSGSGYTAQDNLNDTITLFAPGPGTEANGFIVTIVINPTIDVTENSETGVFYNGVFIDSPGSAFHGLYACGYGTAVAGNYQVRFYNNGALVPANTVTVPTYTFPNTTRPYTLVHDPIQDRIYLATATSPARYAYVDNTFTFRPPSPTPTTLLSPTVTGVVRSIWNAVNGCKYFASTAGNRIHKIDLLGVETQITGLTGAKTMGVNPVNGDVWVTGTTSLYIVDVANAITDTLTFGVNEGPRDITYYPGTGVAGTDRMYVAVWNSVTPANSYIRVYNMDGTVATASLYVFENGFASTVEIHYSTIFNMLFLTASIGVGQMGVDVLALDGSVYATIPISTKQDEFSFVDDTVNNKVINTGYTNVGNIASMRFYESIDDGDVVIDGAMEGGTDDVIQEEDDQCVGETHVSDMVERLIAEAGCYTCADGEVSDGTIVPPVLGSIVIYYGTSDNPALNGVELSALSVSTSPTLATTLVFPLVDPDEFEYIAIPANAGVPIRFYDPATSLDIAMTTTYQEVINFQTYNVFRTSFAHGGGFSITMTV